MEKKKNFQTVIFTVFALAVGFVVGLFFESPVPDSSNLSGSVGKVDRYRNVKVTENDIKLRNELVSDTLRREQFEKYLMFYYYQALKTQNDLNLVLEKTSAVDDFDYINQSYEPALENFNVYLETAQADILRALNAVAMLDSEEEIPIIAFLNDAQTAIMRLRNHQDVWISFMDAIVDFIETHPGNDLPQLEDAYDLLSLNLAQAAVVTKDKPVLKYLGKAEMMNDRQGMEALRRDLQFDAFFNDKFILDMEKLAIFDRENLGVFDQEKLQGLVLNDMENLGLLFDGITLAIFLDMENLGVCDMEKLNVVTLNDAEDLGIRLDMEKLGVFLDMEQMGIILDMEKLGMGANPML